MPFSFKPKKSLGQYFLISQKIANRLVSALTLTNQDIVLEIGAGFGILTTRLCQQANKVYAVEIDNRLIPLLQENTKQYQNINIINQDILTINWREFKNIKIIGNIPYQISSKIFLKLLKHINVWKMAVITTQREFANRLLAKPNTNGYCALTVLYDFYTEREKLLTIPASAFKPSPPITSTALIIRKYPSPLFSDIELKKFSIVVEKAFKQPRKTIVNNLSLNLKIPKTLLLAITHKNNFDLNQRATSFSASQFYQLTKLLIANKLI